MIQYLRKLNLPLENITLADLDQIKTQIETNKNKISFVINGDTHQVNVIYFGNIPYEQNF